jgi:plasmid replication initiation protein
MNDNKKALVVKSNALIEAMTDMNLQEMRFLAFVASQLPHELKPEKGTPYDMEIDVPSFAQAFEIDPKNAYREVKNLADRMLRRIIKFNDNSGDEIAVGLITKRRYRSSEGRLWFRFDEDLLPHLMGLTERFTSYRIKDVYQFQKPHTWRIYELLKQFKDVKKREFELEDLRWKLGIQNKYPRPIDLKKWVLDPALKEINAASDIKAQYTQEKRGRRIVGFIFHIQENKNNESGIDKLQRARKEHTKNNIPKAPELAKRLRTELRMNPAQARKISDLAASWGKVDMIEKKIPLIQKRFEALTAPDTSLGGYSWKALDAELTSQMSFNLFEK